MMTHGTKKALSNDYMKLLLLAVLLVIGILMITSVLGSELIVIIIGVALAAYGVISLLISLKKRKSGIEMPLVFPIIMIVLGALLLIFFKPSSAFLLPLIISAWAIITGITQLMAAIGAKKANFSPWLVMLIIAIIVLVLGIIILTGIFTNVDVIGVLLGIYMAIFSIVSIISWFIQKSFNKKMLI